MADEKPNKYVRPELLPIPTYDEATSSRPQSSHSFLGPSQVSHDAERQGLLPRAGPAVQDYNYRPPTVESARSSLDFLSSSRGDSSRSSVEGVRREIEEMEVLEPGSHGTQSQMGRRISKRITSITNGFSSLNLPFREYLPSAEYLREHLPNFPSRIPQLMQPGWIMVVRFLALLLVVSIVYVIFISNIFSFRQRGVGQVYDPESVRIFVQQNMNETFIRQNLEHLTQFDHIAGTEGNFVLAKWVEAAYKVADLDSAGLERFDVYLNYPKKDGRRVAIVSPPELAFEAKLEEETAYKDPPREQTLVFHGYSKSGNANGPLIYANYGSREDFKRLQDSGINLKGAIALVRYYGTQTDRALKVKAAEMAGTIGCIIYSDPADDGFGKGKPFPDGRYMPSDGVQRGTVGLTSWIVGDVLSPGFASLPGESKRISKDNNPGLNNIPSIPLAWRDAQKLLQALKGHGKKISDNEAWPSWKGDVPDVEWWTGDQSSPIVNLKNEQEEVIRQPIYNVVGKIVGYEQPEKTIIVGNHRDAWCFGAGDPGSGTAVFLEVVRIFGELRKLGWRPLRTIEFASWDAEEYNLIGSTEHVESRTEELRRDGIAYLNVDVAVLGNDFQAAGSPLFEKALLHVLDRTSDPVTNKSLREIWDEQRKKIGGLGAGSDYVAFQDIAGTSSFDMSFGGDKHPYHSCYDNFQWMNEYGDPGFRYHRLMGEVWALLILELADRAVLPFDLEAYARAVHSYIEDLQAYSGDKSMGKAALDLTSLRKAADVFTEVAEQFHSWDAVWMQNVYGMSGFEGTSLALERMNHNAKMARFETDLLDIDGGVSTSPCVASPSANGSSLTHILFQLAGREQYKHVIFAPQAWSGYDGAFFPGIRDAIDEGNWSEAQKQVDKVVHLLLRACRRLLQ
jgi:hypothetical protein